MKKTPQRHNDRRPRLVTQRVTVDEAEIATSTIISIEVAPDVAMQLRDPYYISKKADRRC